MADSKLRADGAPSKAHMTVGDGYSAKLRAGAAGKSSKIRVDCHATLVTGQMSIAGGLLPSGASKTHTNLAAGFKQSRFDKTLRHGNKKLNHHWQLEAYNATQRSTTARRPERN